MQAKHVSLGLVLVAATVLFLTWRYFRLPRRRPLPVAGWLGLAVILLSEVLLGLHVKWVGIYFTPLAWTGYILLVDSLVTSLEGSSRFRRSPANFIALAALSAPLWLIFEAFNLRLKNWAYIGLPSNFLARDSGYLWAFATIWPAIFETADLTCALGFFSGSRRLHPPLSRRALAYTAMAGFICVAVPLLVPARIGSYLFGAIWVGFALLLDPLNYLLGGRSLLREWEEGSTVTLKSFLFSGIVCGFVWEFWNYWARARWIYIFPILQGWKIFEMPAPGFLGFPPFAIECFVMFEFLLTVAARFSGSAPRTQAVVSARREA
ncbi:MAG TPA: hypothetical protein VKV79_01275 [Terriglobia bacterium]|nr:hypothetical protein [Terriglobia bacterium]